MTATGRRWLGLILGAVLALGAAGPLPAAAQGKDVLVFAAASLKTALDEIAAAYRRETGTKIVISYAGSDVLARQIEAAAPADLFISADTAWMDHVAEKGLIAPDSRGDLLGNRIVLVAASSAAVPSMTLEKGVDIAALLGVGRLAMANTATVPAGRYGRAALEWLDAWDGVAGKLAQADNVRAALAFVARGEAPLGIVYRTDAAAEPNVRVVAPFPEASHPPIIYPAALLRRSTAPEAAAFLAHLRSPSARPAFEKQGFTVLAKTS